MISLQKAVGERARLRLDLQAAGKGLARKFRQVKAREKECLRLRAFLADHQLITAYDFVKERERRLARQVWEVENNITRGDEAFPESFE
jgi:hypothetical protein